ncbi:PIN domain-containing protein, partial [Candidatus Latescibacterota bacterium]
KYIFERLLSNHQKAINALNFMKEYQIKVPVIDEIDMKLPDFLHIIRDQLNSAGFEIIENWTGPIEQLIEEAVDKYPPFEAGGKGFRDAVILESFIFHASQQFNNPRIIVISNDDAMRRSEDRFLKQNIIVTFVKENEITDILKESLDSEMLSLLKEQKDRLLKFAKSHEEEILAIVKSYPIEYTDSLLNPIYSGKDKIQGRIQSILGAKPIRVTNVIEGAIVSLETVPADRYPIIFVVEIELDVIVSELHISTFYGPSRIAITDTIDESKPLTIEDSLNYESNEKRITIKRDVHVRASLSSKGVEEGTYQDLKLESVF